MIISCHLFIIALLKYNNWYFTVSSGIRAFLRAKENSVWLIPEPCINIDALLIINQNFSCPGKWTVITTLQMFFHFYGSLFIGFFFFSVRGDGVGAVGVVQKLHQSPFLKTTHMSKEIKNKQKKKTAATYSRTCGQKKKEVEFDSVLLFSLSQRL